jgi:hypothetical protein
MLTQTNPRHVSDAKKLSEEAPEMLERVERGEATIPQAKRELGWSKPEKPLAGEDRRPVKETLGEDFELPAWNLPPERKEYANVVKNLVRLSKLDPEAVASYCKGEYEADRDLEHVAALADWLGRYEAALKDRRAELRPGNLRAVR